MDGQLGFKHRERGQPLFQQRSVHIVFDDQDIVPPDNLDDRVAALFGQRGGRRVVQAWHEKDRARNGFLAGFLECIRQHAFAIHRETAELDTAGQAQRLDSLIGNRIGRSGDVLAGLAAETEEARVAAQFALADLLLRTFLNDQVVPYEADEVTRLIVDTHDADAFAPVAHLTVGGLRDWLLSDHATSDVLAALAPGITPEMAAAVSKISRAQDLVLMATKCHVATRFRDTVGLPDRLSTRLQPNHPTDDPRGIAASILDGLLLGSGDATIGINPATDSPERTHTLLCLLDEVRQKLEIPTQSCVLSHVTTTLDLIRAGSPVDLVFQSIGGTEATNRSFGFNLSLLEEAQQAAVSLKRGTVGTNVMYFETGQGSALSANAHHGVDQQTLEARAYAVARRFEPFLVNTVVGFIGPEYLFNGKQNYPGRARGSLLRQAAWGADRLRCLLHQSCRS